MASSKPKRLIASLITAVMVVTGATAASSTESESQTASPEAQVEAHLEAALATQPDVRIDTAIIPEGQVIVQEGTVSAPSADSSQPFSISLEDSSLDDLGLSATTVNGGVGVAVTDEGDGAFRTLFYLADASSPTVYRFEADAAFELIPLEDGGITVRTADGDLAGTIAPPWAVDHHGAEVPTDYTIVGNTVTQRVHTTASTAFPVVADPFWIPGVLRVASFTRHALNQAKFRNVSQTTIRNVVQNGKRTPGNKGTSVFTLGKGANKIRVIIDNKTGNIITITKG